MPDSASSLLLQHSQKRIVATKWSHGYCHPSSDRELEIPLVFWLGIGCSKHSLLNWKWNIIQISAMEEYFVPFHSVHFFRCYEKPWLSVNSSQPWTQAGTRGAILKSQDASFWVTYHALQGKAHSACLLSMPEAHRCHSLWQKSKNTEITHSKHNKNLCSIFLSPLRTRMRKVMLARTHCAITQGFLLYS